jgi:clan AA aspartic protease (TIGR02281 family)
MPANGRHFLSPDFRLLERFRNVSERPEDQFSLNIRIRGAKQTTSRPRQAGLNWVEVAGGPDAVGSEITFIFDTGATDTVISHSSAVSAGLDLKNAGVAASVVTIFGHVRDVYRLGIQIQIGVQNWIDIPCLVPIDDRECSNVLGMANLLPFHLMRCVSTHLRHPAA